MSKGIPSKPRPRAVRTLRNQGSSASAELKSSQSGKARPQGLISKSTRRLSEMQIVAMRAGIQTYGFIGAVIIDGDDRIVCGYSRIQAALRLG